MNIEQTNTITLTGVELVALKHALHTLQAPWKPAVVVSPPTNFGDYTELQATAAAVVSKLLKA